MFLIAMNISCPHYFIFWELTAHASVLLTALIFNVLTPNALQDPSNPITSYISLSCPPKTFVILQSESE